MPPRCRASTASFTFASGAEIIGRDINRFKHIPPRPAGSGELHAISQTRFIISGSQSSSATMDAIFERRNRNFL